MLKATSSNNIPNRLVSQSGRKDRLRQLEPEGELPENQSPRPLHAAFGLLPLVVPYEDSPPELRILNTVSAGLLFEGRSQNAEELGMTKSEFSRAVRSLRASGAIYVDPGGRFRLGFSTANFPNVTSR
jgi:hypothetical protein